MRYLLILTLCLAACAKDPKKEVVSEVTPHAEASPAQKHSIASPGDRVKVSEGAPVMTDEEGWVGPKTSMSGAWEKELHNCMDAQTALPKAIYEAASPEEQAQLRALHSQILTQWDMEKRFEKEGCEAAFSDLPTLAQCTFHADMALINPTRLSEKNRAFLEKYSAEGSLRFRYNYYNPRTALDEPLFEERCASIKGEWTSVKKESDEYRKSVQLYADKVGRTGEDAPAIDPSTLGAKGAR